MKVMPTPGAVDGGPVTLPPGGRCVLCGAVLAGAVAWDQHNRVFCARHRANGRHCRHCDQFFLPAGRSGNKSCDNCAAALVFDRRVAETICADTAHWFAANGLKLPQMPGVWLCNVMPASPLRPGTRMLGYTEQQVGGWQRTAPPPAAIVLASGLPLIVLRMVTTHELGHVLIAVERLRLSARVEEGACDWLAHRHLGTLGTREAAFQQRRIETRDDPIYGSGFRDISQRMAGQHLRVLLPLLHGLQVRPLG